MGQSVVDLLNSRLSQRSNLTEEEVWKVFSDVLVAVGRLHHRTKPIIHRDLKVCWDGSGERGRTKLIIHQTSRSIGSGGIEGVVPTLLQGPHGMWGGRQSHSKPIVLLDLKVC